MKKSFNKLRLAAFVTLLSAAAVFPAASVSAAPVTEDSQTPSIVSPTEDTLTEYQTPQATETFPEQAQQDTASESSSDQTSLPGGELQHYFFDNNIYNAGTDTGYSEKNTITVNDPHFGWNLGKFNLTGYTSVTNEDTDNPVFLKTVGDKVTLWFKLDQDIEKLNGDENLKIADDANGYDEYFGITETDFKKGTLIVKHSDYQNKNQKPVTYKDYLNTKVNKGTNTKVELFEEGDYEVALDYEIEKHSKILLIHKTEYFNYRIFFKFSVRNGNCMVYPFDVKTNEELTNSSITPNGFRLDLAKSRYLDINIKKEILRDGAAGLTEDVRFNGPAKDGAKYTSEGIYTITVSNRYTDQQTTKKIYVGSNNLLKAYMTTGLSISQIKEKLDNGAQINDDGTIVTVVKKSEIIPEKIPVDEKAVAANSTPKTETMISKTPASIEPQNAETDKTPLIIAFCAGGGVILISGLILLFRKKFTKND